MSEDWAFLDYEETELIEGLEPDQLAAVTARPLEAAHLSRRGRVALWALRVLTLILGAMVVYTFVYHTVHPAG